MSKVRWGLIGTGDIAKKRIAPALRDLPNCELVSVSRLRAELAEEFAREFGAKKWFGDWREQISDPEIDAVYIATPVFLHAEQTITAANAGKHVLCEKPMALDPRECDQMIEACVANNVKLGIAYYRRFYPVVRRVKEILDSGEIGRVSVAQINAFEFMEMEASDPRHWFLEKSRSGGGPMMDFGCHRIEVLTNIFGNVDRVESLVTNSNFDREVEDTATALLHFENGTHASITVTHASVEPKDSLSIYGTKGSIHIDVLNVGELQVKHENGVRNESYPPDANFHKPLIKDFADAILQDREPEISGECGREVAMIIDEIYKKGS